MPPLLVFKLLAEAFGVEDIDEWVDKLTDDNGDWIPLDVADERARTGQEDRGTTGTPGSECAGGPMHESVVVLGEEIPDGLSFDEKCARVAELMTEFSTKPRA
jgi:hypothetical protein